jgi:feruloyl-CoA synthase
LRSVFETLTPGLVYASDGARFSKALHAVVPGGVEIVVSRNIFEGSLVFSTLADTPVEPSLQAANAQVGPDSVFRILFSQGEDGTLKGVIHTHRTWGANQEMMRTCLAFLADEPPVMVDGQPWSEPAGGNADLGLVLYNGGSLYIDNGRASSGQIDETVRNLRRIAPTFYKHTLEGFGSLLPHLRAEAQLASRFFSRLKVLYCESGAGSAQLESDFSEISTSCRGAPIRLIPGFTAAETGPQVLLDGRPAPGLELKLVPHHDEFEARFRGPSITPGYWRRLDLSRSMLDEEGFLKLGRRCRFIDRDDPLRGVEFL